MRKCRRGIPKPSLLRTTRLCASSTGNNALISVTPIFSRSRSGENMSKSKRPVGRPKTTDLVTFSVKIPRKLQATLDKAAADSLDSRNMVIRREVPNVYPQEKLKYSE